MIYGLYSSAFGGKVEMSNVDVISNNLANVDTAGFRKDFVSFKERLSESMMRGSNTGGISDKNQVLLTEGPLIYQTSFDRTGNSAILKQSNQPLDVAIEGDGYFAVNNNGSVMYTRQGSFQLDAEGFLCMADGITRVLSSEGDEIYVGTAEDVSISEAGDIRYGEVTVARLGVVDFTDRENLKKFDKSLLQYTGNGEVAQGSGRVRQRFLELSSVNPVEEMKDMISSTRLFETNMKMLTLQNETLERTVNGIGRIQV